MKLIQKAFLKGTREFEIMEDTVYVRIKGLLKEEKLTVGLSTLDPEPVADGSELQFHGLANRGPLLSLLLNNPNNEEFDAFVETLRQRILGGDIALTGAGRTSPDSMRAEALSRNVFEEPPEFQEADEAEATLELQSINTARLDEDITMLTTYLDENDISPLLDTLEALKAAPQNEAVFQKVVDTFNDMGALQGAILTYAPYLKVILSESIRY
jgi:hypothetical protein